MKKAKNDKILLAHGGGGQLSDILIRNNILPRIDPDSSAELNDSARLELQSGSLCFTTDSYVVKPLFFNGGDIGKLAVCGTVNDLAVAGAKPVALSLSLIIETGLEFEILDRILAGIGRAARENNIKIVTGDTKTVEAGAADKLFINTAGIGVRIDGVELGFDKIAPGDKIIINGTIGDHGMTIISQREGMQFETQLQSDCAGLAGLTSQLLEKSDRIKFMRDPTRGGLAASLNEIARQSSCGIIIRQNDIPVNPTVQAAADMLGFDVLDIANEGKFISVVAPDFAAQCLKICREHPLGKDAGIIGEIVETSDTPLVELETAIGGKRIVQMPYGRELPRIC
ncbi:MAG: hydrogenase expression/formation protein HypE [Planctomycetota bacterium]|jgi:hydrogenase expression/formation protein HypE